MTQLFARRRWDNLIEGKEVPRISECTGRLSLRCTGAVLSGVMQAQSRAHAGLRRNGAVLLPNRSGEDSKVRQAIRRSYQRHHLLRTLSGRRDIHIIHGHVVSTGMTTPWFSCRQSKRNCKTASRDVHSAIFMNEKFYVYTSTECVRDTVDPNFKDDIFNEINVN